MMLTVIVAFGPCATGSAMAQDPAYKEGTVWSVTLIKVKAGMFNQYMRDLATTRKPVMEEAQKQGLILSQKMLAGSSSNHEDFNMVLMVEYKNWAAFDGLTSKFDAINSKLIGSEDKRAQISVKRTDMREILGGKSMQEVHFK
jgi:hypothetical protein